MEDNKKVGELDLCRAVAMLAVVMIHVSAPYCGRTSGLVLLGMTPAQLLNQAARFAVPLFVLLSGTSLGLSSRRETWAAFYRRRFRRIGVPYLIWVSVYELYNVLVPHSPEFHALTADRLARDFLQGQGTPHLYFVVIILQCYLVYPLLKRAVNRAPAASVGASLACTGLIQLAMALERYGVRGLIPQWLRPYLWLLFPTWAFYFVLGIALDRGRLLRLRQFASAHRRAILALTPVAVLLYSAHAHATGATESIKLVLDLYVPWMLLACFALWQWIGGSARLRGAVTFLSARSMTVYFSHVLLLWELQRIDWFTRGISGMLPLYGVTLALSLLLAWLLDGGAQRLKRRK